MKRHQDATASVCIIKQEKCARGALNKNKNKLLLQKSGACGGTASRMNIIHLSHSKAD
jgi:hypothetical protein